MLEHAGIRRLRRRRRYLKVLRPLEIADGDRRMGIYPASEFRVQCMVDYAHPAIGRQEIELVVNRQTFSEMLARARTFGFLEEVARLRAVDLIRGGSLDNAIVLTRDGIMNGELRFPDEFGRHKTLDLIGDLALVGRPLLARVVAHKAGHALHTQLVSRLLADPSLWTETTDDAPELEPAAAVISSVERRRSLRLVHRGHDIFSVPTLPDRCRADPRINGSEWTIAVHCIPRILNDLVSRVLPKCDCQKPRDTSADSTWSCAIMWHSIMALPISSSSFWPRAKARVCVSTLAKVLHRAGGQTLVEHVVRACRPLKARAIVGVVGHQARASLRGARAAGRAHGGAAAAARHRACLLVARRALGGRAKFVIVVPGDAPLVRTETLAALARTHRQAHAAATILSAEVAQSRGLRPHPAPPGRLGGRHRRGFRAHRRSARHRRNQRQYLRLHSGKIVAVSRASAAGKRASRNLSHRRDRAAARTGRNRARSNRARRR